MTGERHVLDGIFNKSKDGLFNSYTGVGSTTSATSFNSYVNSFMSSRDLAKMYSESRIARLVVDIFAEDATRSGWNFTGEYSDEMQEAEKKFNVRLVANEAIRIARLQGGAITLIITKPDSTLSDPNQPYATQIKPEEIKKDSLLRLRSFDRFTIYPSEDNVYDVLREDFLKPQFYTVNQSQNGTRFDSSRTSVLEGNWLPYSQEFQRRGFGASAIKDLFDDISGLEACEFAVRTLFNKANIDTMRIPDLNLAAQSNSGDDLKALLQLMKMSLSNDNMAVLDSNSTFDRHQITLTGVAQTLKEMRTMFAGKVEIPASRLWMEQSSGLNNTNDSDMTIYNQKIRAYQENKLKPYLIYIYKFVAQSHLGFIPDDLDIEFSPLAEEGGTEQASRRNINAQTDATYSDLGIVTKSQIMKRLKANDEYDISDEEIQQQEKIDEEQQKMRLEDPLGGFESEYMNVEREDITEEVTNTNTNGKGDVNVRAK